ncbi:MAG: acyl-CoA synthetase [Planctomycetaceae bacterium]|jgi:crotonobetaine/carnitine-CoA ligase|nr:acyl-CoA synthetase [Planctomycetaceae bacterium]MDP7208680.1 AMP-binding protein [Acidimicrobiales bacterium]|tara:strand:+ start:5452 stop:6987 length:1536 start_codon:yes stop_codon:yes gene_type:complete
MTDILRYPTFSESWTRSVERRGDHSFLVFEDPNGVASNWTYSQFDDVVSQVAGTLSSRGVVAGSAVHMALANSPAFVAVWLAVVRLGAWVVPSDPMGRASEFEGHIRRTSPVVGICETSRSSAYLEACGSLSVIQVDEQDPDMPALLGDRFSSLLDIGPTDRAGVMFTSGTTGEPKGVEVTQANYAFAGRTMAEAACLDETDRQLVVLPMFHVNAQYYSFASAIWAGASVALMSSFSASGFMSQAARHGATAASLFAAPLRMILARGRPVEGLRLRHCWYAQNITADQYETVSDWFGCRPRQLYGMTETIPAVLTDEPDDPEPSSMGLVTTGCIVDVQRPDGTPVDVGEVGEVVVGGERGTTLFAGYLDDPATTEASFRDGWFLTGDRAIRDETGRHYFDGRRSDVLKVAGENVSVVEVETVLAEHPGVLEAAVIGRDDEIRDELPVAFVVADPSALQPSVADLDKWCAERLAKVKRPVEITFLDELPRTSVGKIRKFLLDNPEPGKEIPK